MWNKQLHVEKQFKILNSSVMFWYGAHIYPSALGEYCPTASVERTGGREGEQAEGWYHCGSHNSNTDLRIFSIRRFMGLNRPVVMQLHCLLSHVLLPMTRNEYLWSSGTDFHGSKSYKIVKICGWTTAWSFGYCPIWAWPWATHMSQIMCRCVMGCSFSDPWPEGCCPFFECIVLVTKLLSRHSTVVEVWARIGNYIPYFLWMCLLMYVLNSMLI